MQNQHKNLSSSLKKEQSALQLVMTSTLYFLQKRQCGITHKNFASDLCKTKLNYDSLFERLACKRNDVYTNCGNGYVSDVPPFVCKFRKDTRADKDILAVAVEEGDISMLNADATSGNLLLHSWKAHQNAIFDICWLPDRPALVTASGDNSVAFWDGSTCDKIATFCNHLGSVKCVDVCPFQSSIFASGARDGKINVWDTRVGRSPFCTKPEITITNAHSSCAGEENCKKKNLIKLRSVTSVLFQDDNLLASAGVGDQTVKVWDLRRPYVLKPKAGKMPTPKHSLFYGGDGCTSLAFDSIYKNLFACCTNSVIYHFDCHTYNSHYKSRYHGFKVATYFIKLAISSDDQYLLCGSSDENAYIWKVSAPGPPIVSLTGHSAEVSAVSWHPRDITKLATCGDDNRTLIWKVTSEKENFDNADFFGSAKPLPTDNGSQRLQFGDACSGDIVLSPPVMSSGSSVKEKTLKHFFSSIQSSPCSSIASSASFIDPSKTTVPNNVAIKECDISSDHNRKRRRANKNENNEAVHAVLSPTKILNEQNISSSLLSLPKTTPNTDSCDYGKLATATNDGLKSAQQNKKSQNSSPTVEKSRKTRYSAKVSPTQKRAKVKSSSLTKRPITSYFLESR